MGILTILGVLVYLLQDVILAITDFTTGNLMGGFTASGKVVSILGFLLHFHFKFNLFGIGVDSTTTPTS